MEDGGYKDEKDAKIDASDLYFRNGAVSISQVEAYWACPYKHFLRYGLRLQIRPEAELGFPEIGTLLHKAVELFVKGGMKDAADVFDGITAGPEYGPFRKTPAGRNVLRRLRDEAESVCAAIAEQSARGLFVNKFTEVRFGSGAEFRAVGLDAGGRGLRLEGRIDRADVCGRDGKKYAVVIDYKTGRVDSSLSKIAEGTNLQLPVYLAALRGAGYIPAGAFYFPIRSGGEKDYRLKGYVLGGGVPAMLDSNLEETRISAVAEGVALNKDGSFNKRVKCVLSEDGLEEFIDFGLRMAGGACAAALSGDLRAYPVKGACAFCDYADVCGFDPGRGPLRETVGVKNIEDLKNVNAEC